MKNFKLHTLVEDSKVINSFSNDTSHSLIKYAHTTEEAGEFAEGEDGCLISFWSQNINGKFICDEVLSERSILKRIINKERKIYQALFMASRERIFYFDRASPTSLRINIMEFQGETSQVKTQSVKVNRYSIPQDSELKKQLEYQLLDHKLKRNFTWASPDPTLITLNDADYLVVTHIGEQQNLALCLYAVRGFDKFTDEATDDKPELDQSSEGLVDEKPRSPEFRIDGAEMLLRVDDATQDIFFLTNMSLWENDQQFSLPDRLKSKSVVKKISFETLTELSKLQEESQTQAEGRQIIGVYESWCLMGDQKAMNFFRSSSSWYPYVEAILGKKTEHLTLRFFGREGKKSTMIQFSLEPLEDVEDSLEESK